MARAISYGLAGVLEELELERPQLLTTQGLAEICARLNIKTPPRVVAERLRERGWLLPTGQRGVWEFAPAELAGPYSSADPLMPLRAFGAANPGVRFALSAQTAAWALGLADRVPSVLDASFESAPKVRVPDGVHVGVYRPNLPPSEAKGLPTLGPESMVVSLAQRPSAVRSWQGVEEWLPDVAYEITADSLLAEVEGRPPSVAARTGYLLQGVRPDVADAIMSELPPHSRVRFGRGPSRRCDERWLIADAILPFDPRKMEAVA